jgi:hypothetical protein
MLQSQRFKYEVDVKKEYIDNLRSTSRTPTSPRQDNYPRYDVPMLASPRSKSFRTPSGYCQSYTLDATAMADGRASDSISLPPWCEYIPELALLTLLSIENEARSVRILEIMNDFRTLQQHTASLVRRTEATPPDQDSYYLDGYVVLRQCAAESQAILATHYNPGNLGMQSGSVSDSEVQKATLQRCALNDACYSGFR